MFIQVYMSWSCYKFRDLELSKTFNMAIWVAFSLKKQKKTWFLYQHQTSHYSQLQNPALIQF